MGNPLPHATQESVMQREEMELLPVRATLWRMEIEILREIHRYRFAKCGRRFGSDSTDNCLWSLHALLWLRDAGSSTTDLALSKDAARDRASPHGSISGARFVRTRRESNL